MNTENTKEDGIEELIAEVGLRIPVTITAASLSANAPNPESKKAIKALEKATEVVYRRKLSFEYTDGGPILEYRNIKTPNEARTVLRDFGTVLGINVDIISDEKIMESVFEIKNLNGARIFLGKDAPFPEKEIVGDEENRDKEAKKIYTEHIHPKPTIDRVLTSEFASDLKSKAPYVQSELIDKNIVNAIAHS